MADLAPKPPRKRKSAPRPAPKKPVAARPTTKPKPAPKPAPVAAPHAPATAPAAQAPAGPLPVYAGPFGRAQAERLLWRAGFGPAKGQAEELAALGLEGAVRSFTRPPAEALNGPAPVDKKGRALAPQDAWGHDHLWWLDRMVRSNQPLVERMTLVWHDWFATSRSGVSPQRLLIDQNQLFRRSALGSFRDLILAVTTDPAMLIWLDGLNNRAGRPNENFARELMELFTLGAGRGYGEQDVREQARALTGFTADWVDGQGRVNFRFEAKRHDTGTKTVFGKRGAFGWQDAIRLCLEHPMHASFFVAKLWSYFVPTAPDEGTRRSLEALYVGNGYSAGAVVEAILMHPALYEGPRMVKPPAVFLAGMLRGLGRPVDTDAWTWIAENAGQVLFRPPNVAGWDEDRWLDTNTVRSRWVAVGEAVRPYELKTKGVTNHPKEPAALVGRARAFWGDPTLSDETEGALRTFAWRAMRDAKATWEQQQYPVLIENALRVLVAMSPDYQTS